jgi:hypothetical protein
MVTTSSSTTVPAGSVISQNPASGAQVASGSAVALVVSSGPPATNPLIVDTTVSVDGTGAITTAPFDTATPGELLVAFGSSDGPPASGQQKLGVSGAGLTWTLIQRGDLQNGVAEIWTARATTALVGARITAVQAFTGYDQSLTVIAFRGADGTGAGAIAGGLNLRLASR